MSIVIEHLNYVYMAGGPYETKALSDVNLTIRDGEFIGLIGHLVCLHAQSSLFRLAVKGAQDIPSVTSDRERDGRL